VAPVPDRHLAGDQDVLDARREAVRVGIRGQIPNGRGIEDDKVRIGPDLDPSLDPAPVGAERGLVVGDLDPGPGPLADLQGLGDRAEQRVALATESEWLCMSMKPGQTTRPRASTCSPAGAAARSPIASMRPRRMPTSAR